MDQNKIILMEHALGIERAWSTRGYHYKRHGKQYIKSYRNYFQTQVGDKNYNIWNDLLLEGLANSWINTNNGKCYPYFEVSDKGIKELEKERNYVIRFIK